MKHQHHSIHNHSHPSNISYHENVPSYWVPPPQSQPRNPNNCSNPPDFPPLSQLSRGTYMASPNPHWHHSHHSHPAQNEFESRHSQDENHRERMFSTWNHAPLSSSSIATTTSGPSLFYQREQGYRSSRGSASTISSICTSATTATTATTTSTAPTTTSRSGSQSSTQTNETGLRLLPGYKSYSTLPLHEPFCFATSTFSTMSPQAMSAPQSCNPSNTSQPPVQPSGREGATTVPKENTPPAEQEQTDDPSSAPVTEPSTSPVPDDADSTATVKTPCPQDTGTFPACFVRVEVGCDGSGVRTRSGNVKEHRQSRRLVGSRWLFPMPLDQVPSMTSANIILWHTWRPLYIC